MKTTVDQVREWERTAARAASAKGGEDTVIIDVGLILAITDAFVITSGRNSRQVKTIAEEHGGSVVCKSKPGKGTTFEVRFPAGARD